ncbi:transcriptional regulator [Clostridium carboxidivorans P7]|uniref:Transcriptional regulator, PucR family n=1 Tax=Clostridium carboxidivorans P7 TaxID=536227 RepID=C6PTW9_9CLOT|nr:PucR family transcriptional regulator [Clostridium carboxidivorans]AKN33669.1 transcriptional regulator [Clostridium carboxidivorans P7]EET87268.1 transcriptional regulator, PucR family [Clostridium carboxidivorans P7]EFG86733.1 purine catabolism regulatory protein-like family protein [Clostridium carboxidivorans P7]
MNVRFDQLIKLPELKDLKLVGGNKGLFKTVSWFHFIETSDHVGYVQKDELILLTGIGILNNNLNFIELINKLIEKKAAGLIVNIGKYFKQVPDCVKKIANDNDFPVFEIPWEINLSKITRSICNYIVKMHLDELIYEDLLMNIIYFNKTTYEEFIEKISLCENNSLNSFRIIIVKIANFEQYLCSKNIRDNEMITNIKDSFLRSVNNSIWDAKCRPISFFNNESVVFLLINEKEKCMDLKMFTENIILNCKKVFSDININIGIGNLYSEFSDIKKSYIEAQKALKAIQSEYHCDKSIFYSDIGAYKLLTEIGNTSLLKEYYYDTVGKLDRYDMQNNTDFSKIFHTFLLEDGNYIKTAQKLYLHRNTLMYKINKIHEIISENSLGPKVKFQYYIGYLIKYMNNF